MSGHSIVTKQLASSGSQEGRLAGSRLSDYWALTKPEVNFLILITTGIGFYLGCGNEARPFSFAGLLNTLLGTLLVASGTGTLNQYIERKFDAQMRRTARRPAAAGRLKPVAVLAFGTALAAAGTVYLAATVNLLASALGALTLLTYLFLYTPLKRKTSLCVLVGAFPGAMPPLIGWAGASGRLNMEAWILYAIVFLWAVPTFHGNCMDVPRRLRPSRLFGSPQGENEGSFRHFGNRFAADCACRMQHRAISDAARRHFLLRRSTTESRVPVLRGGIRASAIAGGRSPTAGGVHSLSSIVVRTKRDTVQSRQILMGALFLLVSREVSR